MSSCARPAFFCARPARLRRSPGVDVRGGGEATDGEEGGGGGRRRSAAQEGGGSCLERVRRSSPIRVLEAFRAFLAHLGLPGRPLTARGRIRLGVSSQNAPQERSGGRLLGAGIFRRFLSTFDLRSFLLDLRLWGPVSCLGATGNRSGKKPGKGPETNFERRGRKVGAGASGRMRRRRMGRRGRATSGRRMHHTPSEMIVRLGTLVPTRVD